MAGPSIPAQPARLAMAGRAEAAPACFTPLQASCRPAPGTHSMPTRTNLAAFTTGRRGWRSAQPWPRVYAKQDALRHAAWASLIFPTAIGGRRRTCLRWVSYRGAYRDGDAPGSATASCTATSGHRQADLAAPMIWSGGTVMLALTARQRYRKAGWSWDQWRRCCLLCKSGLRQLP